jgi:hypothetical protein
MVEKKKGKKRRDPSELSIELEGPEPENEGKSSRAWKLVVGFGVVLGILVSIKALLPAGGPSRPPDVRIDVNASLLNPRDGDPSSEYVCLVNADDGAVQLAGWRLRDFKDHTLVLGDFLLEPGSGVKVHTGPAPNDFHRQAAELYGGYGQPIWNDEGDTIELIDAGDRRVDETSYGERREGESPEPCGAG